MYALGFHPIEEKPIIFAGDKEGAMGVFDGSQTAPEGDDEDDTDIGDPVISAFKHPFQSARLKLWSSC